MAYRVIDKTCSSCGSPGVPVLQRGVITSSYNKPKDWIEVLRFLLSSDVVLCNACAEEVCRLITRARDLPKYPYIEEKKDGSD